MKSLVTENSSKIEIFTKFYSVYEISKFLNVSESLVRHKINDLLITPDLQISKTNKYSYEKMIKICSIYNFIDSSIEYETYESKMNNETDTNTITENT